MRSLPGQRGCRSQSRYGGLALQRRQSPLASAPRRPRHPMVSGKRSPDAPPDQPPRLCRAQTVVRPRAGNRRREPAAGAAGQSQPAGRREKRSGQLPPRCHRTLHSVECRATVLARRRGSAPVTQPAAQWSNTRIVAQCLAGDERAWSALLDRYKNLIYSIPRRYGMSHQDAADIFQAVCLDLFNELPRLRDAEALQGWLIRVTTNKCYHWKRRQSNRESGLDDEERENLSALHAIAPDVLAEVEREQMVREAIGHLPPRSREMDELLFFEHR